MGVKEIRKKAMDLLARREHSRTELQRKLRQRFVDSEDEIALQLDRLAAEGLQSDQRFTDSYLRMRAQAGFGPQRIRLELRERGIADSDIAAALRDTEIDWTAQLQRVYDKKFAGSPAEDTREVAKRQRFLHYRGFDAEQIRNLCGAG